ncbi:hypothetical protein NLI96_g10385 [Meripilus lineatus]|uniref:Uncharacterized protein n=1 Tax=Meripilus lineatus TaxID=2056292 RepID=A0AAD5UW39_9APHY|nr:hypothetical protein NLI96_g10385 [Physisporinus lineatus]
MEEMQNAIISLIRHCPNLQAFVVDSPMSDSFPPIADALCTYPADSLRTLHVNIPIIHLARLIWLLDALPTLTSVFVEFSGQPEETLHLGAASGLGLTLNIEHLSLRGYSADFIDQAIAWEFPKLHTLAFDFITYRDDFPDLMEFLENVGKRLIELDLNCIPTQDVAAILELCPLLTTFAFNPDWRLPIEPGNQFSILVNAPHENITTIGCHQLLHAFGVGYAAAYSGYDPLATQYIRCSNDLNFAAMTKANFPNLERIRVLSRSLLRDLEAANGPDLVCFERWERWSSRCADEGVRLEDCTGEELGTLPGTSDDEEQDGDSDEEDAMEVEAYIQPQQDSISIIRDVLEECRRATQSSSRYGANGPYMQAY